MNRNLATALAALAMGMSTSAQAQQAATPAPAAPPPNEGSAYVQCDGNPSTVTTAETAARLLGAITLLGIFAKPHEAADASKRKFGEAGVAACTSLLDAKEKGPARRVPLILGRAAHRIEAKQYEAAIADVTLARDEAKAAGFMADPAYVASQGRSFDEIEGAALLRMGRYAEARDAFLRAAMAQPRSIFAMATIPSYREFVRESSPAETEYLKRLAQVHLSESGPVAHRLEELGRFEEAARYRDALIDFDNAASPEINSSLLLAQAAVTHALAGDRDRASKLAAEARANFDKRVADGKPETDSAAYVEEMDLYTVLDTAASDLKAARRLFAARSQWVSASFGTVVETNRRLRQGAASDELIGGLAPDPDAMWKKRADARLAQIAEEDKGNRVLFGLIEPVEHDSAGTALAKNVWRTDDKDKILLKPKTPPKSVINSETLFLYGSGANLTTQAYLMHAALMAKARGKQGFVIENVFRNNLVISQVMTGNKGDPGMSAVIFNDADQVIADLKPMFPDPSIKPAS